MNDPKPQPRKASSNHVHPDVFFMPSTMKEGQFKSVQLKVRLLCEQDGAKSYVRLLQQLISVCCLRLGSQSGPDNQWEFTLRLLVEEIRRLTRDPFLADLLRKTLEEGQDQRHYTYEFHRLRDHIRLQPLEHLVLASALALSWRTELRLAATRIIHNNIEQAALMLRSKRQFESGDMDVDRAAKLLVNLFPNPPPDEPILNYNQCIMLLTAACAKYGSNKLAPVMRSVVSTLSLPRTISVVQLLVQLGPDITTDEETLRALLSRFGITEKTPPHDLQVAEIVIELLGHAAEGKQLCNVATLVYVLSSFSNVNWTATVLAFDRFGRTNPSTATIELLTAILLHSPRNVPDVPHACRGFWASWQGSLWQLRLLNALLWMPSQIFNFAELPGRKIITHKDVVDTNPNFQTIARKLLGCRWNVLSLIETWTRLGDNGTAEVQGYVQVMMDRAVSVCPELVLLGIFQLSKNLNQTGKCYLFKLFDIFFNDHPNQKFVFTRLWEKKPKRFISALRGYYANNVSDITRIYEVVIGLEILDTIIGAGPSVFALHLAVLASRRQSLDLDQWLTDCLATHNSEFAHAVIVFLHIKLENEIALEKVGDWEILENQAMEIVVFISALDNIRPMMTPEDAMYFTKIRNQYLQRYPHLAKPTLERSVERLYTEICKITRTMTLNEVVQHLSRRGCADLTNELDLNSCGSYPVSCGGFGDIYKCKLATGSEVVVKAMRLYLDSANNQKTLKRTARELYTWSQCQHPNIQRLLGLAVFRNTLAIITFWEMNGNLASVQVADGLEYLHTCGVVHGDLKCANILVSQEGIPQLADFGNATLRDSTLHFTETSTEFALSSRWAAPELFQGGHWNNTTDVYALGMTILEIITGKIPWWGKTEHTVMFSVMSGKFPERPSDAIPEDSEHGDALWLLLRSCWRFEPQDRPRAQEVKLAIQSITQDGLISL